MTTIPDQTQIIQFSSTDGSLELGVSLQQESVWLSLSQMADLLERDKSVISRHIKKISAEEEWERDQAVAFFATTAADGKCYQVEHFSLDVIPFIDGNKRIGCFLFLTYLKIYAIPVSLFTNEALVALALLTAQSDPKDKDLMTKLIMHVIPSQGQTHGL